MPYLREASPEPDVRPVRLPLHPPPLPRLLRPSLPWLASTLAVLGWRAAAWGLRDAFHAADATWRGAAKGVLWDVALVTAIFAVARAFRARGSRLPLVAGVALLVVSTLVRALDASACYLTQAHWSADGFLYLDAGWAGRLLEPAALGGLSILLGICVLHGVALVRDGRAMANSQPPGWSIALLLVVTLPPAAWAIRDGVQFPAAQDELRLVPEVHVVRQALLWYALQPRGDLPPLDPVLRRVLIGRGLEPERPLDPAYPLLQEGLDEPPLPFPRRDGPLPNVVLTLAEGLDAAFVHQLSGRFAGVMPETSALARQMTVLRGFQATASPTIAGLITTLCSVHPPSHPHDLAQGQTVGGVAPYTCLPDLLRQHGYRTVFVQSTSKEVMGLELFLRTHGVDEVHARGEFEKRFPGRATGPWGMYDDAMVDYVQEQVLRLEALRAQDKRPFLLINLTLESHDPGMAAPGCQLPPDVTEAPDDAGARHLLAAYHCSDRSIGRLARFLLEPGRRDRTLWLLTADHAQFATLNSKPLFPQGKRQFDAVPWLLHDPLHDLPPTIDTLAGTTDTAPTLLHLLGIAPSRHSLTGHSVFGRRARWPWLVGRIGTRFAYLHGPAGRVELSQGELRRRCQDGRPLLDPARDPLTACQFVGWLERQDALWAAHRLFPREGYLGDRGADRAFLQAHAEPNDADKRAMGLPVPADPPHP